MSRIRYLKPEFFEDENIAELPFEYRLLYQGLWNIADKAGRLEDRPKRIKIKVFPYDTVDVEIGLQLLSQEKQRSTRPFIVRYSVRGEKYIQIVNWYKHQKPHHTEKESVLPSFNGKENGEGDGEVEEDTPEVSNGSLTVKPYKSFELKCFNEWNSLCGEYPALSTMRSITPVRRKHLKNRFINKDFVSNWGEVLKKIPLSQFLLGKNDRGWTIGFDFVVCNDENYQKILEGKYLDKQKAGKSEAVRALEEGGFI